MSDLNRLALVGHQDKRTREGSVKYGKGRSARLFQPGLVRLRSWRVQCGGELGEYPTRPYSVAK